MSLVSEAVESAVSPTVGGATERTFAAPLYRLPDVVPNSNYHPLRHQKKAKEFRPPREMFDAAVDLACSDLRIVAERLYSGDTIRNIAKDRGMPFHAVRFFASRIEWQPEWRAFARQARKVVGPNRLSWNKIVEMRQQGMTLQSIADAAGGVTRERIRQVVYHVLGECSSDIGATQKSGIPRKIGGQWNEAYFAPWRALWAEGKTISEMSAALRISRPNIAGVISRIRYDHPTWFPHRRIVWR